MTAIHPKTSLVAPEHYWIVSAGVVAAVAVGYFREQHHAFYLLALT